MQIQLLTVGEIHKPYFRAACADYLKRLQAYAAVELASVRPEPTRPTMSPGEIRRVVETESQRLRQRVRPGAFVFVLDSRGKELDSEQLAAYLDTLLVTGRSRWAFLVGGPLGLSPALRQEADYVLSLSKLTFPHELVPLLILEQLYRAFRILRGEPYHR